MRTPVTYPNQHSRAPFGQSPSMMKTRRLTYSALSSANEGFLNIQERPINEPSQPATGELSTLSACQTILCIYVGNGLLSTSYAVAKGGWISIPILGFFCFVADISGKMLVQCFNTPECKSSTTYAHIVDQVLGFKGAVLLIIAVSLEFLGIVCICMLFVWANLEILNPGVPRLYIVIISTAVFLPTVWLLKLSEAAWLSLLGSIATICIVFTLVFVRIYYGELEDVDYNNTIGPNLPLSMGIFMLILSGHAALPQVYREMSDPADFNKVVDASFFIMFIYSCVGVVGYLIYGSISNIIISTNLIANPGGILPKITIWLIIMKSYLSISPLIAVLCNSIEVMMKIDEARLKQRMYRTFVFLIAAGISYLVSDAVPFIESFTAALCTMLTSFILPALLFGLLKREQKSWMIRCSTSFIGILGVVMTGLLSYGAFTSLLHPDK